MSSPFNEPMPAFVTAVSIADANEHVVITSPRVIVDDPQSVVVLHGMIDITLGADSSAVTLLLKRGATTAGTLITEGGTWGPFTVVPSLEAPGLVMGFDEPGMVFDEVYVLTVTVTDASAASTVNAAYLEAIVIGKT